MRAAFSAERRAPAEPLLLRHERRVGLSPAAHRGRCPAQTVEGEVGQVLADGVEAIGDARAAASAASSASPSGGVGGGAATVSRRRAGRPRRSSRRRQPPSPAGPSCRTCPRSSWAARPRTPTAQAATSGRPWAAGTREALGRRGVVTIGRHHHDQRPFRPLGVGHADDRSFEHFRVPHHRVLELDRRDPLAAGLDDVLGAVGDLMKPPAG